MYDNITIDATVERDEAFDVISRLGDFEIRDNPKMGMSYIRSPKCGNGYKGLYIGVYPDTNKLKISGSLAKYYFGNNVDMLTRELTEDAVCRLSHDIGIDLLYAKVIELEFGANFRMSHPVHEYTNRMGEYPRMNRIPYVDTIYYRGNAQHPQRTLKLYNKQKELIDKNIAPCGCDIKNLFRIEVSYRCLKTQLKAEVYVSTLYDEAFYKCMVQRFGDEYNKISKHKEIRLQGITKNMKPKQIANAIIAIRLQDPSLTNKDALNILKAHNVAKDRKYYTRALAIADRIANQTKVASTDERIIELDKKIEDLCEDQMSL